VSASPRPTKLGHHHNHHQRSARADAAIISHSQPSHQPAPHQRACSDSHQHTLLLARRMLSWMICAAIFSKPGGRLSLSACSSTFSAECACSRRRTRSFPRADTRYSRENTSAPGLAPRDFDMAKAYLQRRGRGRCTYKRERERVSVPTGARFGPRQCPNHASRAVSCWQHACLPQCAQSQTHACRSMMCTQALFNSLPTDSLCFLPPSDGGSSERTGQQRTPHWRVSISMI
jgi:hypothetical protein